MQVVFGTILKYTDKNTIYVLWNIYIKTHNDGYW